MKVISVMYHDIVEAGRWKSSGFETADADVYKLDRREFAKHLKILRELEIEPQTVFDVKDKNNEKNLLITFDDGGESAYTHAADLLEEFGWRGHFFVATDFIGAPAFLNEKQIRELAARGHIVGSHSASHPLRMASCAPEQLLYEWRESAKKLSDITGAPVTTASVPGGYFSRAVAVAAARSGIEFLFNSEPRTGVYETENCRIFGRFAVRQSTSENEFRRIVKGDAVYKFRQYAAWNAKKLVRKIGGRVYERARKKFFENYNSTQYEK
jgi:peptidoglycan/xylan/chitin deacetylase (PgdA/CDA1 family)